MLLVLAGGSDASLDDIDGAIRLLDEATRIYDKAMLIEDSDAVNAALRRCAKLLFSLRFWKQTKEAR